VRARECVCVYVCVIILFLITVTDNELIRTNLTKMRSRLNWKLLVLFGSCSGYRESDISCWKFQSTMSVSCRVAPRICSRWTPVEVRQRGWSERKVNIVKRRRERERERGREGEREREEHSGIRVARGSDTTEFQKLRPTFSHAVCI